MSFNVARRFLGNAETKSKSGFFDPITLDVQRAQQKEGATVSPKNDEGMQKIIDGAVSQFVVFAEIPTNLQPYTPTGISIDLQLKGGGVIPESVALEDIDEQFGFLHSIILKGVNDVLKSENSECFDGIELPAEHLQIQPNLNVAIDRVAGGIKISINGIFGCSLVLNTKIEPQQAVGVVIRDISDLLTTTIVNHLLDVLSEDPYDSSEQSGDKSKLEHRLYDIARTPDHSLLNHLATLIQSRLTGIYLSPDAAQRIMHRAFL